MCIHWDNDKLTNCLVLDELDIQYEKPKFDEIPLDECSDEYLGEQELVRKYLRKRFTTEPMKVIAEHWLDEVIEIMSKLEMVFYRP